MKITHHVPTEQYGYTEVEYEGDVIDALMYTVIKSAAQNTHEGIMSEKEYNVLYRKVLQTECGYTELEWFHMSIEQRYSLHKLRTQQKYLKSKQQ